MRRRDLLWAVGAWVVVARSAQADPFVGRRLSLRNANTGETFSGPYRDANGPVPSAMAELAVFMRDHHSGTVGPLDVALIDLLSDVMAAVGETKATILSGYRTAETNARLALTTFGVAERTAYVRPCG